MKLYLGRIEEQGAGVAKNERKTNQEQESYLLYIRAYLIPFISESYFGKEITRTLE